MQIDNCLIEIDGPEIPILNGSAQPFIDAIEQAGIKEQNSEAKVLVVTEKIEYISESGSKMVVLPNDKLEVDVTIAFNSQFIQSQQAILWSEN